MTDCIRPVSGTIRTTAFGARIDSANLRRMLTAHAGQLGPTFFVAARGREVSPWIAWHL
jgi:hypothetical protein